MPVVSSIAAEMIPPRILIIDDDPIGRAVLENSLRPRGFDVSIASNGQQGRVLAESEIPDLILLDLMMPGENGFETLKKLALNSETAEIPVIIISALDNTRDKVAGLEAGAVDYITKPLQPPEVLARVRLHLKLSRSRQALFAEQASRLRMLGDAQRSFLPRPGGIPGLNFAVSYLPVQEAGGDFYDVLSLTDREFWVVAADISGHDIGASFQTGSFKALLRQNSPPVNTPIESLRAINSVFGHIMTDGMYATAVICHVDLKRGRVEVVCAGHPPPLLVSENGTTAFARSRGDVLGAFPSITLESLTMPFKKGDRLFLYTDGVVEKTGTTREEGMSVLEHRCAIAGGMDLKRAVDAVMSSMVDINDSKRDDALLLALEA